MYQALPISEGLTALGAEVITTTVTASGVNLIDVPLKHSAAVQALTSLQT